MNDTDNFLRHASALGSDVHQDIFSDRTRELQRYLIATSAVVILVTLGVYSVTEVELGPAVLVAQKSGWVSLFALISVAYFLILYVVACWADIRRQSFKAWDSVDRMKTLITSSRFNFLEVDRIFKEMLAVADEHRQFLESKGIEADDSAYRERSKLLRDQLLEQSELGQAKNQILKSIARGSVWRRRLSLLLEVIVPIILALLALALIVVTATWKL